MPAETDRHERTIMAWPTVAIAETGLWGDAGLEGARAVYAEIARTVAQFELITMVAAPADAADAVRRCGGGVEGVPLPVDDSGVGDPGPIGLTPAHGLPGAPPFRVNAR